MSSTATAATASGSSNTGQFIQVSVNLNAIYSQFQNQSIPIFCGIVGSFVIASVALILAFIPSMKAWFSSLIIIALGSLTLFVDFILYYVDTNNRKNAVQTQMNNASTNLLVSASQLECPQYFEHAYNASNGTYYCKNINEIGSVDANANPIPYSTVDTSAVLYNSSIPIFATDQFYPYEVAFANISYSNVSTSSTIS